MTISVTVGEATKSRLEELQSEIELKTGRKVPQQELLETIVDHANSSKREVIEAFRDDDGWDGLSPDEIVLWLSGRVASGSGIDEDEIDEIIYDEESE